MKKLLLNRFLGSSFPNSDDSQRDCLYVWSEKSEKTLYAALQN